MNSGNITSSFTKDSGGLPNGKIKLPRGSGLTKNTGGLGGNSKYKSYPKWVRDEIHGSEKSKQREGIREGIRVGWSSSDDDSDDSLDDQAAPPKSEQEAEKQHERTFTRDLNNEIAKEEGFSESEHSEDSDPEHMESVLTKIHNQDGNETDNSVDFDDLNESRGGLTEEIFSIFKTTPNTQKQVRDALEKKTPNKTKVDQLRKRLSLSAQKPQKPSQLRNRHETTPFRLPERITRQTLAQPSPDTLHFPSFAVSPVTGRPSLSNTNELSLRWFGKSPRK